MNWKPSMLAFLLLSVTVLAVVPVRANAAEYSGRQQNHDMTFLWNIERKPDAVTIKGVAKNTFHSKIYQLQLFAVLLDENGRPQGKEAIYLGPIRLDLDQPQPFTLSLPADSSVAANNIRLEYRYHVQSHTEWYWPWIYGRFNVT